MKDINKELVAVIYVPVSADTPPFLEDTTDAKAFNVLINGSVFSSGVLYKDGFWSYDTTLGKLTHWLKEVPAQSYAEDKAIEFAEWMELQSYFIKGMDDNRKRVIYKQFLNRDK